MYAKLVGLILIAVFCFVHPLHADTSIIRHDAYLNTDVNFFDSENNKVYLDEYEESAVLVVFWATWCGACVHELPLLDNLQKDFRKLPFQVIAISQDYQGIKVINQYFIDHEIRHLKIFHDHNNQLFRSMNVVGLPTAYLINANGKLKLEFRGSVKWYDEEIRKIILAEIDEMALLPKNTFKQSSLNQKILNKTLEDTSKDSKVNQQLIENNKHNDNQPPEK